MDTTLVTISRFSTGRSPFQGGQDHFSHRLVKIGLPVPAVVVLTYVVSAGIGVLSFVVSRVDPVSARILTGLIISTLLLVAALLAMVPVYPESSRRHFEIGERPTDG
jgi:UDP-GlcNAc:undecaprenyl-phosphate GlcNAc-1-phosphate transferase